MTTFIFILSHKKKKKKDNDAIVELSVSIKGGVG